MGPMRLPAGARLGVALLVPTGFAAAGCAGNAEPRATISAVTPSSAYSDSQVPVVIAGGPFRPIYDVDTSSGSETLELGAFTVFLSPSRGGDAVPADDLMWLSTSAIAASLPGDITPGPYDVEVRDPRGSLALLPAGFVSLGPDMTPPVVTIDEPPARAIVNAGSEVPVAFEVDDGPGSVDTIAWTVSTSGTDDVSDTCIHAPDLGHVTCRFVYTVKTPTQLGQPLNIIVTATDSVGNVARAQTTLSVGITPTVGAFAPFEGPAEGGTPLAVHGQNFITGTQVLVGGSLLEPGGGTVMSDTLIQGTTPAHDPGLVTITVSAGASTVTASGSFDFVGRPEVLAVTPSSGPLAGCTPITIVGKYFRDGENTRIWFGSDVAGAAPLQCPNFVSANRIEGFTPPGAGAVSILAQDAVSGVGVLPLAFTYLDVDAADGGPPPFGPAACPCPGGPP
jgi:hypothetical protein